MPKMKTFKEVVKDKCLLVMKQQLAFGWKDWEICLQTAIKKIDWFDNLLSIFHNTG